MPAGRIKRIHGDKERKAHRHHAKQFKIMAKQELARRHLNAVILLEKAVSAEEKEHRHAVMTEERQQVHGQLRIGMHQGMVHARYVFGVKGVLVLFNYRAKPMAIVVQEYAYDGQAAHTGVDASGVLAASGLVGVAVGMCRGLLLAGLHSVFFFFVLLVWWHNDGLRVMCCKAWPDV